MNGLVVGFLLVNAIALLVLPRRWAALPLLVGTCYIPFYPSLELGPLHFNAIRVLVAIGGVRVITRGEWNPASMNGIDRAMLLWAGWMLLSSAFHNDPSSTFIFRLGLAYDACGIYALIRSFCRSVDDIIVICQLTAVLLVPLAAEMLNEKLTVHNLFSAFGGVGETPIVREGHVRANGPFGHAILAGTVGGVCLPLMIGLWRIHRKSASIGIIACLAIVMSSASSGPILSAAAGIWGLLMWRYRDRVRILQSLAVIGYIALDAIMKDPAYFLIARIDLAGGSTSWYRARLIQSAIEHLPEWWFAGTDYTRHWMWVVMAWSTDHTDITSHYVQMGVYGGLLLLCLFLMVLAKGFAGVTQTFRRAPGLSPERQFLLWAVGCSLFAHALTMFSVSYFDQSFVFLYIPLAAISAAWSWALAPGMALSTEAGRSLQNRASGHDRTRAARRPLQGWAGTRRFGQMTPVTSASWAQWTGSAGRGRSRP